MRTTIKVAMLASFVTLPVTAQQNVFELSKGKSEKPIITKTSYNIELTSSKVYDKYIISVSGDGGYNQQFESQQPSLNLSDFDLPYDGSYNYEIRAIKHVTEMKDTMNNGRPADAVGKISVIDVTNGQFTTEGQTMKTFAQDLKEPKRTLEINNNKDTSHE